MLLGFLVLLAAQVQAEQPVFTTEAGAMAGFDPVEMIERGVAQAGDAGFSHDWEGATFHFVSSANRDAFARSPEKYAPQYGGFCAVGTTHGGLVPSDPDAFVVRDGKLYLNSGFEQRETWLHLQSRMQPRADEKWAARLAAIARGDQPARGGWSSAEVTDLAMGGMDVVSYFSAGKPSAGDARHTVMHAGKRWQFASAENAGRFRASPARFVPQFGGACTVTMAHDFELPGDPGAFLIHNDRLYLALGQEPLQTLQADSAYFIARAEKNWSAMRK
jgi:YHS domain-containing protein